MPACTDTGLTAGETTSNGVTTVVVVGDPATATASVAIPTGVSRVTIDTCGAQGSDSGSANPGGLGGRTQSTLDVTGPTTLTAVAGTQDGSVGGGGSGANNGGGYSGVFSTSTPSQADALVVAGGGGGSAATSTVGIGNGGAGGGDDGAAGTDGSAGAGGGGGATSTSGGAAGSSGFIPAGSGTALQGGDGGAVGGAGGGGGYYGGGGGGGVFPGPGAGAGGGGGSGFVTSSRNASGTVQTQGVNDGQGVVVISYDTPSAPVFNNPPITYVGPQGQAATRTVTVSATPSATMTVTQTSATPTSGITFTTGPNSATFTVSTTTPPGTYTFDVTADNGVGAPVTQTETFTITAAPASATPTATSSPPGGSSPSPAGSPSASSSPTASPTTSPPASVTPSTSATASPSASSSASPSASASASQSPSGSPSASPASCIVGGQNRALVVHINTRTINATGLGSVTVTGAQPGQVIDLQGYSQNHRGTANFNNDPTPVDRSAVANANGAATFSDLRPASNTRLRAKQRGCAFTNIGDVINVRAQETFQVSRNGRGRYTFSGHSLPARPGGLIVNLYRIVGQPCAPGVEPRKCPSEVFIGQGRAVPGTENPNNNAPNAGDYVIRFVFKSSDLNSRDEFVVKTGQDAQNAPGRSNVRSLLIF